MGLTATPFVLLLIFIAVAMVVLTVWLWPRLARRGALMVLARLAVLCVTQLTVVAAFAAGVNASFLFYTSWDDLLGTQADSGQVRRSSAAVDSGRPADPLRVLGHRQVEWEQQKALRTTGRVDRIRIRGQLTGMSTDGFVYLPPEYFLPGQERRSFPVAVVLTGFPGNAEALLQKLRVPQQSLTQVRDGRAVPTIYVMLRSSVGSRDLECTDVPGGPQAMAFLARDVPKAVKGKYRAARNARSWAVMGNSTGGYCALKLAMLNPDVYPNAVSLSGYYHAVRDDSTGELWGGSPALRQENDLLWRLRHRPAPPVSVLLATSRTGEENYRDTRRFEAAARRPMVVSTLVRDAGGHNFNTWRQEFPHALWWLRGRLQPTDPLS
jgi:S-formylglutathione hydrolase FrmB